MLAENEGLRNIGRYSVLVLQLEPALTRQSVLRKRFGANINNKANETMIDVLRIDIVRFPILNSKIIVLDSETVSKRQKEHLNK